MATSDRETLYPHLNAKSEEPCPLVDLDWLREGAPFPPHGQGARMERYAKNRALWKGDHDRVYGNWWRVLREDQAASLQMVFNWHKRLSTLWADLLLSEPPRFLDGEDSKRPKKEEGEETNSDSSEAGDNARQEAIDRITGKENKGYVRVLYKAAIDISRYGDGLVKVMLKKDGVEMKAQPPSYWYPVVDPNDLTEFTHHVLAWKFRKYDLDYLRVEIHEKGKITHRAFELKGNLIGPEVNVLAFLPMTETGEPKLPDGTQETNVDDFLLVPFQGLVPSDEIFGDDDYTSVDSIIQGIEVRAAQIARVLDKHTDPSMYGPPDQLEVDKKTGETVFKAGGKYFEVDGSQDDVPPGYITWEGQLEAQFTEIDTLLKQLYILSETSPAAFGQLESGIAESGSALRRLMQAPLAKVARIALNFDPAAKHVIQLAAELERKNGRNTPELPSVNIQWQDGLPPDPKENAETEEIRQRAGNTSLISSIRRLDGGTQEDAEAELERIKEEQQEQADLAFENTKREVALMPEKPAGSSSTPGKSPAGNGDKKK